MKQREQEEEAEDKLLYHFDEEMVTRLPDELGDMTQPGYKGQVACVPLSGWAIEDNTTPFDPMWNSNSLPLTPVSAWTIPADGGSPCFCVGSQVILRVQTPIYPAPVMWVKVGEPLLFEGLGASRGGVVSSAQQEVPNGNNNNNNLASIEYTPMVE